MYRSRWTRHEWLRRVRFGATVFLGMTIPPGGGIHAATLRLTADSDADGSLVWPIGAILLLMVALVLVFNWLLRRKVAARTRGLSERETRYRMLAEESLDIISVHDRQGGFRYASPAVERLIGYTADELLGKDGFAYVVPEDRARVKNAVKQIYDTSGTGTIEYRLLHSNGTPIWVETKSRVFNTATGEALAVTRDVAERKQAEEKLRRSEERLAQVQKLHALGQLAGGIAHDFNNMLGGIIGFADLARDALGDNEMVSEYLDKVITAGERAQKLAGQILRFSRQTPEQMERTDVPRLLDEVVSLLKASIPSSVMIQTRIDSNIPEVILDGTRIHEVVMNLATNAVHAMQEKGTLTIEATKTEFTLPKEAQFGTLPSGEYIHLRVADTGCGMTREQIARSFEPFFTTRENGRGIGLGLSVVQGTIISHGGDMCIESTPEKGTAFNIFLPMNPAETEDGVQQTPVETSAGSEHILLVDDEEMLVEMMSRTLGKLGYRVTACVRARDAMALIENGLEDFDLLLSDFSMPEFTGLDLAMATRKIDRHFPVIICSGHLNEENQAKIARADVSAVCAKPVRSTELSNVIRFAIRRRKGEMSLG